MLYIATDKSKTASGYYKILEEKVKIYGAWRQVTSNKTHILPPIHKLGEFFASIKHNWFC